MKLLKRFGSMFFFSAVLVVLVLLGNMPAAPAEPASTDDANAPKLSVAVAAPVAAAPTQAPGTTPLAVTNLMNNGSFEDTSDLNSLNGWFTGVFNPAGGGDWKVQTSTVSPITQVPVPPPTDGQQAAILDHQEVGSFGLYQDVTLPSGVTELSYDMAWQTQGGVFELAWTPQDSLHYEPSANKQISVDLMDPNTIEAGAPSSNVLANLFRTQTNTPTTTNGYLRFKSTIRNDGPPVTVRLRFLGVNSLDRMTVEVDRVILSQPSDTTPTQLDVSINQIDTDNCPEVRIITSVRDQQGNPVTGLTTTNFVLREDTQIRTITRVTTVDEGTSPLFIAILIDRSGSLSFADLAAEKAAAKALVSQLEPAAQVAVYSFGSSVRLVRNFTSDRSAINTAIDSIPSGGNTALYDAVVIGSQNLGSVSGRRALVLMTDGEDTASSSSLADAIAAARAAGTPVFPIGFGSADSNVLTQLASQTGGFFSASATSADLQQILNAIGQVLSSQYEITFTTSSVTISHTIELTVTSDGISGSSTSTFQPCGTSTDGINITINQVDPSDCPTVRVITSVRDSSGAPIVGLTTTNFTLREDNIERTITVRTVEDSASALSMAILIDRSGSLFPADLAAEKAAAKALVSQLRSNDQVAVYSFGSTVNLLQNFTSNRTAINNAIDGIALGGDTRLYDAVVIASQLLETRTGRKAIVLMTDGEDTVSTSTKTQAIAAAGLARTPVFPIGFGNADSSVLLQIANLTGGFFSNSANSSDLQQILNAIGQVLSSQYEITFTTTDVTRTHTIQVGVIHGDFSGADTASLQPCGESTTGINVNINQVEVTNCPTIRVITSVRDSSGISITGLTTTNFTLRENGIVQTISVDDASSSSTLSLAILIDRSGSLTPANLADEKAAAKALVAQLQPLDAVAVFSFGSTVTRIQDYTTNRPAINNAIDSITSGGETSLYDAVFMGAESLIFQTERKAIALMTDGVDTASSKSLQEAIAAAVSAGVPVFPIGFGNANATVLTQLANQTGGFFSASANSSDLQSILSAIGQVLKSQYEIVFTGTQTTITRSLEIAVKVGSSTGTAATTLTPCEGAGTCEALVIDLQNTRAVPSNQLFDIPTLDIPVTLSGSCEPSSFQFDIIYDSNLFSGGFLQPTPDTVLTQAGKDVTWNPLTENSTRIVASGLNQNTISDGSALKLHFVFPDFLLEPETTVLCSNAQAVDAQARPLTVTCSNSTVTFGGCSCDIDLDGIVNVKDIQLMINQVLDPASATCDLNGDGLTNVGDLQIVINAALGDGCNP